MKIEYHLIQELTIEQFADRHDLVMMVHERSEPVINHQRYYAYFKGADVKHVSGFLCSLFGNGNTPEDAINNYARSITEKLLIVTEDTTKISVEIRVPHLVINNEK